MLHAAQVLTCYVVDIVNLSVLVSVWIHALSVLVNCVFLPIRVLLKRL